MSRQSFAPASSTSGFFQALPVLPPQYTRSTAEGSTNDISDDRVLARMTDLYLPSNVADVTQHIHHLARRALDPAVLKHATDAETNHPVLRPLTTFGEENKYDPLWTTTGWQKLKEIGYEEGVVAVAYDKTKTNYNRRVYEFALNHVWGCTATMTGCPMSMTDGAALLISKHLNDEDGDQPGRGKVFAEAYRRLISRDPGVAWTSGQWMTERTGGSDVSGTETVATRVTSEQQRQESAAGGVTDAVGMQLGPWSIDGFKWFSSATDSEMTVLLARTGNGGLSAFYVPMRRRAASTSTSSIINESYPPQTELNGIRISRLKNKLGTKSLPTAELELKGSRGWLIGTEGQGIKEISSILNITRLYTGAGSTGGWGRGLAVCRAYSKVRKVRGGLLQDNPAHLRWMANETVKYYGAAHFAFFNVALQGAAEQEWEKMVANTKASRLIPRDGSTQMALQRLLTPVMKAQVSVAAVHGLRECMECLGGVGYCENNEDGGLMNIAKVYRDTLVNPIWEGTVNVMAEDVVRVLLDKRIGGGNVLESVFAPWARGVLSNCTVNFEEETALLKVKLQGLLALTRGLLKEDLLYRGREILEHIDTIVCGCLLIYDATVNKDSIGTEIAKRWVISKALGEGPLRSFEMLTMSSGYVFGSVFQSKE
ncbi:hypothetical protein N0V90_008783 [Kalmusia sp. IMI 367209]|nr:hypothetical protein N0V90_008783 [Kalmusia sp. IMI 367209]